MVEGDGCHRVAAAHRRSLVGRRFVASSPNGKFRAGAKAIGKAGGVLQRIEVHGKNMFYFFGKSKGPATLVVHVHFGMAGAFAVYQGEPAETTPNTRLRLASADGKPLEAHLSAMTVEHGSLPAMYTALICKLGPDPLRGDAKPDALLEHCATAKQPIGAVLMDQRKIAGVGNIYRSETLYEAKVHPDQPANTLTRPELLGLWRVIVRQMQAGFKTGSIWGGKKGGDVYDRKISACGGKVRFYTMGGRNVYACAKRQLLDKGRKAVASKPAASKAVRTGTAHLGRMTSAAAAEGRKRKAGESFAVQHVALKDDATLAAKRRAAGKKGGVAKKSRKRA